MSQDNPTVISVPFHGDSITAIDAPEGAFVAVKPICERFGLAWQPQHRKLTENPRWGITIMVIPSAGGAQEMTCIPVSKVFGWLGTIAVNRVKPELKERLALYQAEADTVLDRHFRLRATETSARIEAMEKTIWHAGQFLLATNPKWNTAYRLMEMGQSDYIIAKRCGWSMDQWGQERAMMRSSGVIPKWREDMATLADENSDLRWKLSRAKAPASQPDLFGEV